MFCTNNLDTILQDVGIRGALGKFLATSIMIAQAI